MTIKTGAFLPFLIIQRFGLGVVLMVTLFAFLIVGFDVAIMERFIQCDWLPCTLHARVFDMALSAGHRTGRLILTATLFVAANALVMVNAHDGLFVVVLNPFEFLGQLIFGGFMTGRAIFVLFGQRIGVLVVVKKYGRSFQRTESVETVYGNHIRTARICKRSFGCHSSGRQHTGQDKQAAKQNSDTELVASLYAHFSNSLH